MNNEDTMTMEERFHSLSADPARPQVESATSRPIQRRIDKVDKERRRKALEITSQNPFDVQPGGEVLASSGREWHHLEQEAKRIQRKQNLARAREKYNL